MEHADLLEGPQHRAFRRIEEAHRLLSGAGSCGGVRGRTEGIQHRQRNRSRPVWEGRRRSDQKNCAVVLVSRQPCLRQPAPVPCFVLLRFYPHLLRCPSFACDATGTARILFRRHCHGLQTSSDFSSFPPTEYNRKMFRVKPWQPLAAGCVRPEMVHGTGLPCSADVSFGAQERKKPSAVRQIRKIPQTAQQPEAVHRRMETGLRKGAGGNSFPG